ncbi:MAG: Aminodeoxyfutalosine deaminase [Anaerolineales bacterium]|nr:Aminodeoxyfutalosine deaminase [Anaerolineales bacterium]
MISSDLPLIDLHRHLDGNVRLQTVLDLGRKHNIFLPAWDVESLRPYVQVTTPQPGIMAFIAKFKLPMDVLADYEACRRVAYENVEDAKNEGMDYVELRFSPWFMAESHALHADGVVEAVVDGTQSGQHDFGLRTNLIGIISRTFGPETCMKELESLLTQREHIAAFDLAGDEANFPATLFIEHFKRARDAGWQITVHAGEVDGPQSVWSAIRDLGARRLGHAIRSIEDPTLLDYLAENKIGVENNLTSNVQTSCVPDYPSHPLKLFLERGILATLNTDDPGISGIDLPYEYNVAAPKAGLTNEQIRQAQKNALEIAFLSDEEKINLANKKRQAKSPTRE